jgi:hypothetical protein
MVGPMPIAHTTTGVTCAHCSTRGGITIKHVSVNAVRACSLRSH